MGATAGRKKPCKKWSDCAMEDMKLVGVEKHVVHDRWVLRAVIAHPTKS